ncbi:hypothetical protein DPSP01_000811 [Paraphaeosphaeria sporulosa]
MAPNGYGVPNPFPLRAQAERENARTRAQYASVSGPPLNPMGVSMPYVPSPNPYPHPPVAPQPRRVHTGRLANRFAGRATHQDPFTHPPPRNNPGGSPVFPFAPPRQANPDGSPAYLFSPPVQNMYPRPQAYPYTQYPGPHMAPEQNFTYAPPPMMGSQRMESGAQGIRGSARASHFPSMSSLHDALPHQAPLRQPTPAPAHGPPPRPEYLIVGLFALRLTQHLIMRLDPYAGIDAALRWLEAFLRSYDASFDLAKLKDPRSIEDYVRMYPGIVRSMIKQPKYRRVFMDMDPDKKIEGRDLSDGEYATQKR